MDSLSLQLRLATGIRQAEIKETSTQPGSKYERELLEPAFLGATDLSVLTVPCHPSSWQKIPDAHWKTDLAQGCFLLYRCGSTSKSNPVPFHFNFYLRIDHLGHSVADLETQASLTLNVQGRPQSQLHKR